jgi:hypothetical protein
MGVDGWSLLMQTDRASFRVVTCFCWVDSVLERRWEEEKVRTTSCQPRPHDISHMIVAGRFGSLLLLKPTGELSPEEMLFSPFSLIVEFLESCLVDQACSINTEESKDDLIF